MNYKTLVAQIASLDWTQAVPQDIIILSKYTAVEFASSLREAMRLYPDDSRLKEMADGELKTDNMSFDDYSGPGDHWEYLAHFINTFGIVPSNPGIEESARRYTGSVEALSPSDRAMTVFSREEELTLIFRKIIDAHDWNALGFGFYRHYLESHILFDSGEGGHHHLTEHFPLHENVLEAFYRSRLELYSALFK